tara:strand:- start:5320 stop:5994 length:675 start_codon:yes stop_codon:yes gene_type:complete
MAVVEELGILLEADPTGLEEGLERANQKTKEFEEQQKLASLQMLENIAKQEAMVSSLNQISGGYAKTITAAQELNFVNDEQAKSLMKARFAFEIIAGPMEVFVAVQKLSTVVSLADVKAKIAQSSATTMAAAATTKLNLAIRANPIGAIITAVVILVLALIALEAKFGLVTRAVDGLKDGFEMLANLIDRVYGSIQGVTTAAAELGDALTFGPVSGVLNVLGGR